MDRRGIVKRFVALGLGAASIRAAEAQTPRATKVVYHLADAEKVSFVLGNLRNHLADAGGLGAIQLAVVAHGPALHVFRADSSNLDVRQATQEAVKAGVAFYACAHTMAAQKMVLADLAPGFAAAPKGGVTMLADLQAQGWVYLRP